jgi:hypothetical protein
MQGPDQKTKCTSFVFLNRPLLYVPGIRATDLRGFR